MRLVACDLDGTIVCAGNSISQRTLAAFRDCELAGVQVVFVTGRPPRWMPAIAQASGHTGLALCGNGAVVLDLATNQVVHSTGLPARVVLEATERLRARLPGATFALETLDGYRREPDYVPRHDVAMQAATGSLAQLLVDEPRVIKVLCRQAGPELGTLSADQMLQIARDELAGLVEVVHSDPASFMLEISAAGVTKAAALARLSAERGIPASEVVAFGDMPNDVSMLLWAGAGYAMSGGHPDALAAAPRVAPPCAQDGVAQVLEELLRQGARPAG